MNVKAALDAMAACLCAEVNADNSLCFCGIIVGDAPYDVSGECGGKCGQAWVRLVGAYPQASLGEADLTDNNCRKALGLDLEIGVMRCFPVSEDPPSEAELLLVSDQQVADMLAMRKAILCCDAFDGVILGNYEPIGPEGEGGLVGGIWQFAVGE